MTQTSKQYRRIGTFFAREEVQAYTMAILSFFALAFFILVAIRPTLTSFIELRKKIEDARLVDKQLEDKINALLAAQDIYYQNLDNISLLDEAMPQDPEFTRLLKSIETLTADNEIITNSFETTKEFNVIDTNTETTITDTQQEPITTESLAERTPVDDVQSILFTMSTSADYTNFEIMLKQLYNLRRIILLNTLQLAVSDIESNDSTIDSNFEAGAVFMKK